METLSEVCGSYDGSHSEYRGMSEIRDGPAHASQLGIFALFNQAATDRAELAKLLHISDTQMGYITNAEAGHGLLRIGGSLVPFSNTIPKDTELYKLMSTTPGE